MGQNGGFLLFMTALLSFCDSLNWMAGGSFSQANFDILRSKVNAFDLTLAPAVYANAAVTMSNELNTLWAPAWNVAILYIISGKNQDAVLYGYAFNGQWFWQNGLITQDGQYVSFIIWKDFNCANWATLQPSEDNFVLKSDPTMGDLIITSIQSQNKAGIRDLTDIWKVAQDIQDKVPTASSQLLQDKLAYTVIASQASITVFFGRVCAFAYTSVSNIGNIDSVATGAALILQMRSS